MPFTAFEREALAALRRRISSGDAAQDALLREIARLGGLEAEAAPAAKAPQSVVLSPDGWRALGDNARSRMQAATSTREAYAALYRVAAPVCAATRDPKRADLSAAFEALDTALLYADDAVRKFDAGWNWGDSRFHPVLDVIKARLYETCFLPQLSALSSPSTPVYLRYTYIRNAPRIVCRNCSNKRAKARAPKGS